MPSKISKRRNTKPLCRAESEYSKTLVDLSETQLAQFAMEWAAELRLGDRVLLEGPMGAGKTTFVRSLLLGLGVVQPPEGSPSFAIAHEYQAPIGGIVHIDYYRLKSEAEIDDAGIPAYYWERNLIVISEWLSNWPEFQRQVLETGRVFKITLAFQETSMELRTLMHRKIDGKAF